MKEKKYYANTEALNRICRDLKIVKSKWDSSMEKMPIKGLAVKYFSKMSTGQKDFSVEIYQELARNFTKLYKEKNIQKEVSYKELLVDRISKDLTADKKEKVVYLEKYEEYGDVIGEVNPKLIYNRVRIDSDRVSVIEQFVKSMNSTHERQEKYKYIFYSPEEQMEQIKDEANINSWLDSLKNKGIKVFAGLITYPIISYEYNCISHEDSLYEITSDPGVNGYFILLFSSIQENVEYFKFQYNEDYDYETLKKLQLKFPIKFQATFDNIERFNIKNEANNYILNTLANEYVKLKYHKEFGKIIPDVYRLPFSFNSKEKIIPVLKIKKIKDNEK